MYDRLGILYISINVDCVALVTQSQIEVKKSLVLSDRVLAGRDLVPVVELCL